MARKDRIEQYRKTDPSWTQAAKNAGLQTERSSANSPQGKGVADRCLERLISPSKKPEEAVTDGTEEAVAVGTEEPELVGT